MVYFHDVGSWIPGPCPERHVVGFPVPERARGELRIVRLF